MHRRGHVARTISVIHVSRWGSNSNNMDNKVTTTLMMRMMTVVVETTDSTSAQAPKCPRHAHSRTPPEAESNGRLNFQTPEPERL